MEAKFKVIFDELRKTMPGRVLPADDIYNAIYTAGWEDREKAPLDKEDRCDKCYQQGMKKVVEWIESCLSEPDISIPDDVKGSYLFDKAIWQNYLKENGLE